MEEIAKKPIKFGKENGISWAIWSNVNKDGEPYFQFTFKKSFKTESGEWKDTNYFSVRDLPTLAALAQKLYTEEAAK